MRRREVVLRSWASPSRTHTWTLGGHDLVAILDAPDEETLAAALLMLSSQGNLRTTTLRAFGADEMRAVIAKTG
jgi:uncharacterized protein with GYD domain